MDIMHSSTYGRIKLHKMPSFTNKYRADDIKQILPIAAITKKISTNFCTTDLTALGDSKLSSVSALGSARTVAFTYSPQIFL